MGVFTCVNWTGIFGWRVAYQPNSNWPVAFPVWPIAEVESSLDLYQRQTGKKEQLIHPSKDETHVIYIRNKDGSHVNVIRRIGYGPGQLLNNLGNPYTSLNISDIFQSQVSKVFKMAPFNSLPADGFRSWSVPRTINILALTIKVNLSFVKTFNIGWHFKQLE